MGTRVARRRRWQLVRIALRASLRFRLQTLLVAVSALAGVSSMVTSSNYAQSGAREVVQRYEALGARMVAIAPAPSRAVGGRARTGAPVTTLSLADYRALRTALGDVSAESATVSGSFGVRAGDLNKKAVVIGCEPDFFRIKRWKTKTGAVFLPESARSGARLALLGSTVARDLFGDSDPTGARLMINRVPFTVSGVLEERGRRLDASDEDDEVYIPLAAAMRRLMNVDHLGGILLQASSSQSVVKLSASAGALLRSRHKRFGGQQPDFTITDQQRILDDQLSAFRRFSFLVGWISLSALAVCAVGITGICWVSINYRRRDIGVMRATGACPGDIRLLFLLEALTPVALGSAAGLALGYVAARLLEAKLNQSAWFDWDSAVLQAAICSGLFVAAILLSSRQASRVPPVLALSSG